VLFIVSLFMDFREPVDWVKKVGFEKTQLWNDT